MAVLVQVNFPMQGPWGDEMAEAFQGLAESINAEPGFLWKVWIENQAEQRSGGIYLFETLEDAQAYVAMHTERLSGFGITGVEVRYFDVNEPLSLLNHASLLPTCQG
ncbi:monooxygenase [Luteococcus peritonei]|uniref:Monooxygenase n=1 Tax=Luteococcus peritonei TaxID=88874 RepID=A0ABW4RVG9_9ACTN